MPADLFYEIDALLAFICRNPFQSLLSLRQPLFHIAHEQIQERHRCAVEFLLPSRRKRNKDRCRGEFSQR